MSEKVLEKWKSLDFLQKVFVAAFLPIIILLVLTGAGRSVLTWLEARTRKKIDNKSDELKEKVQDQEKKAKQVQENINKLEKEKKDAVDKSKNVDAQQAVDFWNSHPRRPDK